MKKFASIFAAFSAGLLPIVSSAHPGHGSGNPFSPTHYMTSPEHSGLFVLTVAVCIAFAWAINRRSRKVK